MKKRCPQPSIAWIRRTSIQSRLRPSLMGVNLYIFTINAIFCFNIPWNDFPWTLLNISYFSIIIVCIFIISTILTPVSVIPITLFGSLGMLASIEASLFCGRNRPCLGLRTFLWGRESPWSHSVVSRSVGGITWRFGSPHWYWFWNLPFVVDCTSPDVRQFPKLDVLVAYL